MSNLSSTTEINYKRVALQLLHTGKSTDEVIAQLIKLDLEEYSARALLDQIFTAQVLYDTAIHRRIPAIIGSMVLIVGSVLMYTAILGVMSPDNPLMNSIVGIRLLGFGLLAYHILK